jgi:hypothetical protein
MEVTPTIEPFASFGSALRLPLPPVEHENGGGMQEVQAKVGQSHMQRCMQIHLCALIVCTLSL